MKFFKGMVAVLTAIVLLLALSGCSDSGGSGLIDEETGTIYPDRWYTTQILDGLQFYNCVISDAFPVTGGRILATYIPVCRSCHEEGWRGTAKLSTEEPCETAWSCSCGTRTSVMIRYNP